MAPGVVDWRRVLPRSNIEPRKQNFRNSVIGRPGQSLVNEYKISQFPADFCKALVLRISILIHTLENCLACLALAKQFTLMSLVLASVFRKHCSRGLAGCHSLLGYPSTIITLTAPSVVGGLDYFFECGRMKTAE